MILNKNFTFLKLGSVEVCKDNYFKFGLLHCLGNFGLFLQKFLQKLKQTKSQQNLFLLIFTILIFLSSISISNARTFTQKDRFRSCSPAGGAGTAEDVVKIEDIGRAGVIGDGYDDMSIDTSNLYCQTGILIHYAGFKSLIATMNGACGSGSAIPRVLPSPFQDSVDIVKAHATSNKSTPCITAIAAVDLQWTIILGQIGTTYEIAREVFKASRVCGSNWKRYNASTMLKDLSDGAYKGNLENWADDEDNAQLLNFNSKEYRELYYGGVEREYAKCQDPTREGNPPQRYYFRGTLPGIYNCEKYNPAKQKENISGKEADFNEAYDCCKKASKNLICIEYDPDKVEGNTIISNDIQDESDGEADGYKYKLCTANDRCMIGGVEFETKSEFNNSMICASTYSLCPYNFNLGGGTIQGSESQMECDYFKDGIGDDMISEETIQSGNCAGASEIRNNDCTFNEKAGKCKNYCQAIENCVIVDYNNYSYNSTISSPYFSKACIDFVGDSKNSRGYNTGIFAGNQNHFSAPIAQCVRETIENTFYNIAGHSKCQNITEYPDKDDICASGTYIYKKGDQVSDQNFFSKLQDSLRIIIQIILIFSITLTGARILAGTQSLYHKKDLLLYITKIGIIVYFVSGQAWQTMFFNGVYKASEVASNIVLKVSVSSDTDKRDGCQFGQIKNDEGNLEFATDPYPQGKEYLAIWDTMDCKIARYLGMGSDTSVAAIAKLIFAALFTGTYGIWFAIFLSIFGIIMITATIKMLHIFLASAVSIIIMVYVSIIIIPTMLFSKTKDIFDKWKNNLISLSLQPIILFAYIGIFLSIIDYNLTGSATFKGEAPTKRIVCKDICYDASGSQKNVEDCDIAGNDKLLRPKIDSVACIIKTNSDSIGNFPGFEILGISVPVIKAIFTNEGRKDLGQQIVTILKATLLIYILSYFIGQIPGVAQGLVGGSTLPFDKLEVKSIMKKIGGIAKGASARAHKGGKKATQRADGGTKKLAQAAGNKGKKTSNTTGSGTNDSTSS